MGALHVVEDGDHRFAVPLDWVLIAWATIKSNIWQIQRKAIHHMSSAAGLPKHIHSTGDLPKVAWAKGSYVYDSDGRKYIDGSGGPAVYCIGHSNEEVNDAIKRQLDLIAHGYRYNFSSDALEELTDIVRKRCGGTLNHMVYVTGGSEAVESCLKLALQYQTAIGQMSRRRFIARERSWHGNTLGALVGLGLPRAEARLRRLAARCLAPVARQCLSPHRRCDA